MHSRTKLFRYDKPVTCVAVGEPSLTLIENDSEAFSVLLADAAHEDSFSGCLYLEQVTLLRVKKRRWVFNDFASVVLYREADVWAAQDPDSGGFFHEPSSVPYHTVFISRKEFKRLMGIREEGIAKPIFVYSQEHFGRLPNFDFGQNLLVSAPGYAQAGDRFRPEQFLMPK